MAEIGNDQSIRQPPAALLGAREPQLRGVVLDASKQLNRSPLLREQAVPTLFGVLVRFIVDDVGAVVSAVNFKPEVGA